VSNFQAQEIQELPTEARAPEDVDDVLADISELLETLHSYQQIRSLDSRAALGVSKPSSAEFDSYELLRSQLAILIATLPPFAVAKLDGDKLEKLNVGTKIIVDTVDYRGTAQPDEYTLSRYRAAQSANTPAARPQMPTTQARPTYQTPSVHRYNSNNNLQVKVPAIKRHRQPRDLYRKPNTSKAAADTPLNRQFSNFNVQATL
jgi:hypothetical protein